MAKHLSLTHFLKKTRLDDDILLDHVITLPEEEEGGLQTLNVSGLFSSSHASVNVSMKADTALHRHRPPPASKETTATPSDLSALEEPATQPKLSTFPSTIISGKPRSFNSNWYEKFKWIEYSKERDAMFCKACRHFLEMHTEFAFIKDGYKNWKHLREACDKHEASKPHATKQKSYMVSHAPQSRGTVLNQLHSDTPSFVERKREHIKVVLDIAMLCAKLEIPLRGHRETEDALNRGNFLELFKFMSKYAPEIENRLNELPRNATFMSHHIQDELLEAAASILLRKIKTELHGQYFAILADEYKA